MLKIALITILGLSGYLTTFTTKTIHYEANRGQLEPIKIILGVVTAYTSLPELTDSTPNLTASQKQVQEGFIACPRKYPFGQKFEIEEKIYTCEDRKNIRYEDYDQEWFDIYHQDIVSALEFGIKTVRIKILNQ